MPAEHGSPSLSLLAKQPEEAIRLEDVARQEFMSKAHLFIDLGNMDKVKTIPCWWALMQHHGALTRLLDWTASRYVAAYFATQQDGSVHDGAVWCFCHRRLHSAFVKENFCDANPIGAVTRNIFVMASDWFRR